ncbi:hypothetical protein E3Q16_04097 [Wallemia mellicola]|nr:hypothetical protein E3Q16_04097 [Wallemia mellicola]
MWPGALNALPMTNGTRTSVGKRANQRPAAFVSWVRTSTDLTFSVVYAVSAPCVKNVWSLADVYYNTGLPGNAILNWFEESLTAGEGSDSWLNPVTWPDVLQGETADAINYYSIHEDGNVIMSVSKVTIEVNDNTWFDPEGIGSFIWSVAESMGLGTNVYSNWVPTNEEQAPPGGWRREEGDNEQDYHSIAYLYAANDNVSSEELEFVFKAIGDNEVSDIVDEMQHNKSSIKRASTYNCQSLDGRQCYSGITPYVSTHHQSTCYGYHEGFYP